MTQGETIHPQCVRFRTEDLTLIRKAAKRSGDLVSQWVRNAALSRAVVVLEGKPKGPPPKADSGSETRCVRFRPVALERVRKAAKQEGMNVTEWIRAVAVAEAKVK